MTPNLIILAIAAIIPMVIGFIWYHPKVMGTIWMNASGMTEEKMKAGNLPLMLFISYVFSFMLAMAINGMVIHQGHIYSILLNEPGFKEAGSEVNNLLTSFMAKYGSNFRTFKHGAFHGALGGIFFALPILTTNALYEGKGFKYIAVNAGYWILSIALMGGVICQFG